MNVKICYCWRSSGNESKNSSSRPTSLKKVWGRLNIFKIYLYLGGGLASSTGGGGASLSAGGGGASHSAGGGGASHSAGGGSASHSAGGGSASFSGGGA